MDEPTDRQLWTRTFIEIYRVEDGVDGALLLAAGKSLRFGCEDFYTDEEDGYTGGNVPDGSFTYASGKRRISRLELSGGVEGRILVRVSDIDFEVYPNVPGVPYERIMDEIMGCVCSERLTEAGDDDDVEIGDLDLESALTPLYTEYHAYRTEPSTLDLSRLE